MKLYTYITKRSLPLVAAKGLAENFPLFGSLPSAAEIAEKSSAVVLEVDVDGLEDDLILSDEFVEHVAADVQQEILHDPERQEGAVTEEEAKKAYEEIYETADNLSSVQEMIEKFGVVESIEPIESSRIVVLGIPEVRYPEDPEAEADVSFKESPKPVKAYKRPIFAQLLRSIFLPKHKMYGASSGP